ncbi:unnamed protein product [Durusdinium trenchii]|uniref:Uncharacterized protein n=1 Tax=Durusdinium trenchii TaxID=1381693 RepID=A0ABP0IXD2_9DINO
MPDDARHLTWSVPLIRTSFSDWTIVSRFRTLLAHCDCPGPVHAVQHEPQAHWYVLYSMPRPSLSLEECGVADDPVGLRKDINKGYRSARLFASPGAAETSVCNIGAFSRKIATPGLVS